MMFAHYINNKDMGSIYTALALLIASAFTSATILPGSSEVVLVAFLEKYENHHLIAWLCASIGNTAGATVSYFLGRLIPPKKEPSARVQRYLNKYGSSILLFSWIPFIGDALPIAVGWLRLKALPCIIFLFIGKTFRYAAMILFWVFGGSEFFNKFF